jgi:16S rRNA (cytosine1402-N4)-methyltransferase
LHMKETTHIPVLLDEVLKYLAPQPKEHFIDGTVGQGGHAKAILKLTLPDGRLLGIDRDSSNLAIAKKTLQDFGDRAVLVQDNYANVKALASTHGFSQVDGILLDLGFSSAHIDEAQRGFSFQLEGPLDMRYDSRQALDAAEIVNTWSEDGLAKIFRQFGEERYARQIAEVICSARKNVELRTTVDLAELVASVVRRRGKIHPATRVFQALRIAVNNELEQLEQALPDMVDLLAPGGRLVVISFHSLEDRIIKHFFRSQEGKTMTIKTKRVVTPTEEEIKNNQRARSAKLRVAIKK